jgi:hypothetical protein
MRPSLAPCFMNVLHLCALCIVKHKVNILMSLNIGRSQGNRSKSHLTPPRGMKCHIIHKYKVPSKYTIWMLYNGLKCNYNTIRKSHIIKGSNDFGMQICICCLGHLDDQNGSKRELVYEVISIQHIYIVNHTLNL